MGNYKFRLSDMIPNSWFYKFKDIGRSRSQDTPHPTKKKQPRAAHSPKMQPILSGQRHSYNFPSQPNRSDYGFNNPKASETHFPEPPRRSFKRRANTQKHSPKLAKSSVSDDSSCPATLEYCPPLLETSHEPRLHESSVAQLEYSDSLLFNTDSFDGLVSRSISSSCRFGSSTTDSVINERNKPFSDKLEKLDEFCTISEFELPPILTKPAKFTEFVNAIEKKEPVEPTESRRRSCSVKVVKDESYHKSGKERKTSLPTQRPSPNSPGLKLRTNSPRIASRNIQVSGRKSSSSTKWQRRGLSKSLAVVKSSFDPFRDFRDSMVEMIVENDIRASGDLEELLACYLSLNSVEYHDLIIRVFERIWFDLPHIHRPVESIR